MEQPAKRLLAQTVDHVAGHDPERIFGVIARGAEVSDGFETLTMRSVARGVNFMSRWIESNVGASTRETLAYMGGNDVRYCIFFLACQKTGHKAFFPSTRNSDDAHRHLLEVIHCSKFFFSSERSTQALQIQHTCPNVQFLQIPTLETILGDQLGLDHYPYNQSYADAEDQTICIIHSSGTTGMPKPVYLTNGFFMCVDSISSRLPWPKNRQPGPPIDLNQQDLMLATTPFFHLIGLISFILSIFHQLPVLIGPEKPLSVEYAVNLLQKTKPTAVIFPPSILEEMSHSSEALECLRCLKRVLFGGAPLSREAGDIIRKYTQLIPALGSSEIGYVPTLVTEDEDDWDYLEWNPNYGIDMQDRGDGVYEMVVIRQPNGRDFQGIFHTFPDRDSYYTSDLYTQHPTNAHLWKFCGRQDDVIVLSNGEKFTPTLMETMIEAHPWISRALVVGQSRFQAALLVEPSEEAPEMSSTTFTEGIWPRVQAANNSVAAHGRVMKNKIGFASKDKPFQRTPKGTTRRRGVVHDYEKEIDAIYEADIGELIQNLPESLDGAGILEFVRQIVSQTMGRASIPLDQDLYAAGFDSLMTFQVSEILKKAFQARGAALKPGTIAPSIIYANPTVERLAQFIHRALQGEVQMDIPREEKIQRLVEKYTSDLPTNRNPALHQRPNSPSVVILTGSTGSLGAYLLNSLLATPSVSKVYCLNRSDAETRQKTGFEEKGLHVDGWEDRVQFLQVSFGEPRFSLAADKYEELLSSVDTVIHNAWKVDFNNTVESFEETHIRGMRHFVDFSLASRYNAHIHFVSSISTVGSWTAQMGAPVPEVAMEDSAVVLPQGYGESKHIAERICLEASRRSQVPTSVYRVGQIAGPTTARGQWNRQEWLPTIICTSKALGKIPTTIGSMAVDWVPVNDLASIMVEVVHTRHVDQTECPSAFFHLTNPARADWSSLIPAVQEKYTVEPVPFGAWVSELENIHNPTSADVTEKPALKLLGFYRELCNEDSSAMSVVLDVQRAQQASATMRTLGPIGASLMKNWLQQWDF